MINEEIAAAKRAKRHHAFIAIAIVLLLSLTTAAFLYMASVISLSDNQTALEPEATPSQPETVDSDDPALRQRYLEAFSRFENELKPALAEIDIEQWDRKRVDTLQQLEQQAIDHFGRGDYVQAVHAITTLVSSAEQTLSDSQIAFEHAMQQAEIGYSSLDHAAAQLALNTALLHQPNSDEAHALAEKIANIPDIITLTAAIAAAKAENKPLQELEYIEQLLAIAPERDDLTQRANNLRSQLADSRFNNTIAQARQAIEKQDINQAQQALQRAKQIYPSRPEISQLTSTLHQLESQLRYDQHLRQSKAAQAADNWRQAEQELSLALKEKPNDTSLSEQQATAKRIVALQQEITELLQTPLRLSTKSQQAKANTALLQSETVAAKSPSLAKLTQQLRSTMTSVSTPVDVTVISDGKTFVSVRGVGTVGVINAKIIKLTPGSYIFEGKREGYRSKLVEVMIPLNQHSYQLSVVADERI